MAKNKQNQNQKINEPRINDEIKGTPTLRVVYKKLANENSDEDFVRIMSFSEAMRIAERMELDLVEISPNAQPPVVKLCDYSKYLYN